MKKLFLMVVLFNLILLVILPVLVNLFFSLFFFDEISIEIYDVEEEKKMELELEEYIIGVVAAEMPANFNLEALKAQAVAARTYALKKDQERLLTTDSRKDQAWVCKEDLFYNWGAKNYFKYYSKVALAVEATEGLVLRYNNKLISAVYHSSSGDYTASAKEVWGGDREYLKSVRSKYDRYSPYYRKKKRYNKEELRNRLEIRNYQEFKINERSSSGRVNKLYLGGRSFTGQQLREKLNLYSTNFKIREFESGLEFISSGYGHGVGMSQYGADGMGKNGYDFKAILEHYYLDAELSNKI